MPIDLACIVEGHGEVDAVPELIRRIAASLNPEWQGLYKFHKFRVPKSTLIKQGELERTVELASRRVRGNGGLLILVDADGDCPASLGPEILRRAMLQCGDIPMGAVLAKREYESWFIASAASLVDSSQEAIVNAPLNPEEISGAKEWVSDNLMNGGNYSETLHQVALTSRFDMEMARLAPSFDKCMREVTTLLKRITTA